MRLLAVQQCVTKDIDTKKNVDHTRGAKVQVGQIDAREMMPSAVEGNRVKRKIRGYLGRIMASTSNLPPVVKGATLKRTTD